MSMQKQTDLDAVADRAAHMTYTQLHDALIAIDKLILAACALDRVLGTNDGGYYGDAANVLRAELAKPPGLDAERRRVEDSPQAPEDAPRPTTGCSRTRCMGRAEIVEPASAMRDPIWSCRRCGTRFEMTRCGPRAFERYPAG